MQAGLNGGNLRISEPFCQLIWLIIQVSVCAQVVYAFFTAPCQAVAPQFLPNGGNGFRSPTSNMSFDLTCDNVRKYHFEAGAAERLETEQNLIPQVIAAIVKDAGVQRDRANMTGRDCHGQVFFCHRWHRRVPLEAVPERSWNEVTKGLGDHGGL
jgi:hypothetical protein